MQAVHSQANPCATQVHAGNRPIPREGGQGYDSDALLHQVADRTIGYSGADLANLLNEASILSVRRQEVMHSSFCLRL